MAKTSWSLHSLKKTDNSVVICICMLKLFHRCSSSEEEDSSSGEESGIEELSKGVADLFSEDWELKVVNVQDDKDIQWPGAVLGVGGCLITWSLHLAPLDGSEDKSDIISKRRCVCLQGKQGL